MNGLFHGVSMAYTRPNNACLSDRGFWGLHRPRQTNWPCWTVVTHNAVRE